MAKTIAVIVIAIVGFFIVSSMIVFVAPYLAALIVLICAVSVVASMFNSSAGNE